MIKRIAIDESATHDQQCARHHSVVLDFRAYPDQEFIC